MSEMLGNAIHKIRGFQVKGGFLDGLQVEFSDDLNCLIGGRGTGKTTVLEILRWALGQMPDSSDASARHRNIEKLIQANLGSGQVEVDIETHAGLRYRVRRVEGNAPLVLRDDGEPVEIDIGRGTIFSADVYSQNQIEEIANDPLFQLKLIDKFVTEEIKEIDARIAERVRELHSNAVEILALRSDVTTGKEKVALLPEVLEKLKALKAEEGDEEANVLREASEGKALRDRELRALERLQQMFLDTAAKLRVAVADLPTAVDELVDQAILDGPNGTLLQQIRDLAAAGAGEARDRVEEAVRIAEDANVRLREKAGNLSALHLRQEKAYQDLLEAREKEKDQATERDKLLRRRSMLLEEQEQLDKWTEKLRAKEEARTTLLRRLSDLKDERFGHRTRVAEMLTSQLSPTIRVEIEQHGNTDSYRDLLMNAMKGSGFQYARVVDRVVRRIPPQELAATVQRGDVQALADHLEIDTDRANRLLLQLKEKPAIFEVEVVDLHDRPTIKLKDGPDYKDSTALSTGQKCTTILPILLLESVSPLLVDQPEDNLDNAFIYETVVKSVRGVRGKRQLIFVTHNPNIPVLGDAQQVVVLQSTGRRASLRAVGTVDDVKHEIETILEGGAEAFQKRKERYGY